MAQEWWLNDSGENLLKGVAGDATNPLRLANGYILDFLRRYQEARNSFNRLVPRMLPDEQTRLWALGKQAQDYVYVLDHTLEDAIQSQVNKAGVRTCGPLGGRRVQR